MDDFFKSYSENIYNSQEIKLYIYLLYSEIAFWIGLTDPACQYNCELITAGTSNQILIVDHQFENRLLKSEMWIPKKYVYVFHMYKFLELPKCYKFTSNIHINLYAYQKGEGKLKSFSDKNVY